MGTPALNLGDPLADDALVFRAFALDGFRERKKMKVRPRAYFRSKDHEDGLSVGLTPDDAVAGLATNFGYCRLPVGPVHALPHGMLIRPDLDLLGHALISNVPCIDGTNEERERAMLIAGHLARLSVVVTCDLYRPGATPVVAPPPAAPPVPPGSSQSS